MILICQKGHSVTALYSELFGGSVYRAARIESRIALPPEVLTYLALATEGFEIGHTPPNDFAFIAFGDQKIYLKCAVDGTSFKVRHWIDRE